MAELIYEHHTRVRTPEGALFSVTTCGEKRSSGIWVGWLEFAPVNGHGPRLRTDRETTQRSRKDLESWAAGLESSYVQQAFARAHVTATR
jgi:hypothetical protein